MSDLNTTDVRTRHWPEDVAQRDVEMRRMILALCDALDTARGSGPLSPALASDAARREEEWAAAANWAAIKGMHEMQEAGTLTLDYVRVLVDGARNPGPRP